MKISIRQKLFILAAIIVAVNAVLSYAVYESNQKHLDSEQRVGRSQEVINQSDNVRSLAKQIQLDSKDFLITNDTSFLVHLDTVQKAAFVYIQGLRRLTADNPLQLRRTDSLVFYMHKLVELTQKTDELRTKQGLAASIVYARSNHPYKLISHVIDHFQYGEDSLLKKRMSTSQREEIVFSRFLIVVFVLMGGFTILLFVFAGKYLSQNQEKEKRAAELAIANAELLLQSKEKQKIADEREFERNNLDALINNTNDLMWSIDRDFKLITSNQPFNDIIRLTSGKAISKGQNVLELTYSMEQNKPYKEFYERAFAGESFTEVIYNKLPVNTWSEISYYPIRKGNKIMGTACHSRDITLKIKAERSLKDLNEHLQKQAKELAMSNAELEQFAFVASHDLQEPLRMVTSFMTQLERKYGDVLETKGRQYINFAIDGAKRMRQIILDLLAFSVVGGTEDAIETVDFNKLLKEIQVLYRRQIEDLQARITFENMPVIQTYKAPLRQVFQNLIGNSLKYHNKGEPPVISTACIETKTHFQFAVHDNGIGIAPEYFSKIFIIFKRLHSQGEYPGTGMGLAIVKKIIGNLGGEIWVKSEEGKGSTFYFTMLKRQENAPGINAPPG